jgi:hypothetical protein
MGGGLMPKAKAKSKRDDEHGLPSLALVFGYIAVKELQNIADRVVVLSRLGYGNVEMAKICGTTPAAVATMKHRAKGRR